MLFKYLLYVILQNVIFPIYTWSDVMSQTTRPFLFIRCATPSKYYCASKLIRCLYISGFLWPRFTDTRLDVIGTMNHFPASKQDTHSLISVR